jgi:hypothetical protein
LLTLAAIFDLLEGQSYRPIGDIVLDQVDPAFDAFPGGIAAH